MAAGCGHMCHTRGLNPWVQTCPVCHCPNPKYVAGSKPDPELQAILDELKGPKPEPEVLAALEAIGIELPDWMVW